MLRGAVLLFAALLLTLSAARAETLLVEGRERGYILRQPARPVPLLMLNGTADPLVRYEGGPIEILGRARGSVIAVEATLALAAAANGCAGLVPVAIEDTADDGIGVEALEGRGCQAPVRLVRYLGGGHGWPGQGQALGIFSDAPVPEAPAANDLLLAFFGALR